MVSEGKCWICDKDRQVGDPLMFVEQAIVGAKSYETYELCIQCAAIAEQYYQEWRRDLREILRYRLSRAGFEQKSFLERLKIRAGL